MLTYLCSKTVLKETSKTEDRVRKIAELNKLIFLRYMVTILRYFAS